MVQKLHEHRESKEGDMSQVVPDNGRDGRSGRGVLDISRDIQCLKDGNGLVESGRKQPSILPGMETEAGAEGGP